MDKQHQNATKEIHYQGIGVSPGVVSGPAFLMIQGQSKVIRKKIKPEDSGKEVARFENALIETRRQLRDIQKGLEEKSGLSDANIFDAHLMVLDDRVFIEDVIKGILDQYNNAEAVVADVTDKYAKVLGAVEDAYLRERVADIRDVSKRIISNLTGSSHNCLDQIDKECIIIAQDLSPSETATIKKSFVLGLVTELGSKTSHTALLARSLEIPAIVGVHNVLSSIKPDDQILIDGTKGTLIVNPTEATLFKYGRLAKTRESIRNTLSSLKNEKSETKDGKHVILSANIEGVAEIDLVHRYGAEGVGLFRSEYLFLEKNKVIDEETQFQVYKNVVERLNPNPVIIRTLDLGGDKYMMGVNYKGESNPFLGCRSIRLSLKHPEHFKQQLRAILRASAFGDVKIMYPMISRVEEVDEANALLEDVKKELKGKGIKFNNDIDVGIMIEIPSAAITADIIAKKVDFFSLGTNDLVQYTLAVDRINDNVAYLYEPAHPAIIRLIKSTVEAAHDNGIWVGVCGEMASDPLLCTLLLGLRVDEISVTPSMVPVIKDVIRSITTKQIYDLAERVMTCTSASHVKGYCRKLIRETAPELLELI